MEQKINNKKAMNVSFAKRNKARIIYKKQKENIIFASLKSDLCCQMVY